MVVSATLHPGRASDPGGRGPAEHAGGARVARGDDDDDDDDADRRCIRCVGSRKGATRATPRGPLRRVRASTPAIPTRGMDPKAAATTVTPMPVVCEGASARDGETPRQLPGFHVIPGRFVRLMAHCGCPTNQFRVGPKKTDHQTTTWLHRVINRRFRHRLWLHFLTTEIPRRRGRLFRPRETHSFRSVATH